MTSTAPIKRKRGFALMDPEKHREVAAKGGSSIPAERRAFFQRRDLAAEAGRKGGLGVNPKSRSFYMNRQLAVEAGRKGGKAKRKVVAS